MQWAAPTPCQVGGKGLEGSWKVNCRHTPIMSGNLLHALSPRTSAKAVQCCQCNSRHLSQLQSQQPTTLRQWEAILSRAG